MRSVADTALLERETELAAIDDLLAAARSRVGGALLIEGPPGIGKSALLEAGLDRAEGVRILVARADELERDFAFGVARQLFERPLHEAARPQRERWLSGSAAIAAGLLGASDPRGAEEAALMHGLYWLVAGMAADGPVLLAIDDAHWSDSGSVKFALYLVRRLEGLAVALLVTARTAGGGGHDSELLNRLATEPAVTVRSLPPLTRDAARTLVSDRLGTPEEPFVAACHTASGGNPLLLRELLAAAGEAGLRPTAAAGQEVVSLASGGLQRYVARRLAALASAATAVVRAAAVLGNGAHPHQVGALAGIAEPELSDALAQLVDAHLLAATAPLTFVHPLIRSAVLKDVGQPATALGHARAARLLHDRKAPPERVAAQLMASGPVGEPWALEALDAAAADARRSGAPEVTGRLIERALEEGPDETRRIEMRREAASALLTAGDPSGLFHLTAARDELTDPVARGETVARAASWLWFLGRASELAELLRVALAEVPDDQVELRLELRAVRAMAVRFGSGDDPERVLDEALAALQNAPLDQPATRWAVGMIALSSLFGNRPGADATRLARAAIGTREQQIESLRAGRACVPALGTLVYAAEDAGVGETFALLEAGARRSGALFGLAGILDWRGRWHLLRGRIADAETDARGALMLAAGGRGGPGQGAAEVLTHALVERGEVTEALDVAATALERHDAPGLFRALPLLARARALLASANPEQARAAAGQVGELAEHGGIDCPAALPWRSVAALAAIQLGDAAEGKRLAAAELERAEASGVAPPIGAARRTLGLATRDIEQLRAAEAALADTPAALEHARALVDLGAELRRRRARAAAREPLAAGLELAHRCGATMLAERARTELRAAGARPRRAARTGVDALTPSELRVAKLAADGLTTPEIAQHLFVSPKTVETQLYAAFRKLDVKRRVDLLSALSDT